MATLKAIPGGQNGAVAATCVEPYGFDPAYERALVALCCRDRALFSRVGMQLDPKALGDKSAALLIKAAQAIAADVGEGPSSTLLVIQRLRAWREEGKVTHEQILAANEFLDAAEDAGLPDAAQVGTEAANVLKKRARRESAKKVLDTLSKGGDFKKLSEQLAATERIGEAEMTLGDTLHADVMDSIVASNSSTRFPTGSYEINSALGGGLPLGYTLFLGREKAGKSMVLSSIAADALWAGRNVAIATLELDATKQLERVIANLTSCTLDEVAHGAPLVRARLQALLPQMGKITTKRFTPETPASEITQWAERVEQSYGAKLDLLVVDYIDLVGSGKKGEDGDYRAQKVVGNIFRDHALAHSYCVISASQTRRQSGVGGKKLDVDDVADSMHKVRIADLVVAMRMDPEEKVNVDWYVILNRNGTDRVGTGDLPTNRAMAQMYPLSRETPW